MKAAACDADADQHIAVRMLARPARRDIGTLCEALAS
jgi:hypothetical protein